LFGQVRRLDSHSCSICSGFFGLWYTWFHSEPPGHKVHWVEEIASDAGRDNSKMPFDGVFVSDIMRK
jgi:hypothetical protein